MSDIVTRTFRLNLSIIPSKAGEAVGYTIDCMDGSFNVHEWCIYYSDILLALHQEMIQNKL